MEITASWMCSLNGETRRAYWILVEKFLGKRSFGNPTSIWDVSLKGCSRNKFWGWQVGKGRLQNQRSRGSSDADIYCCSRIELANILVPCATVAFTSQRLEISSLISYEKIAVWLCMGLLGSLSVTQGRCLYGSYSCVWAQTSISPLCERFCKRANIHVALKVNVE